MADLTAVDTKVKWAEKHIGDLEFAIGLFLKSHPYEVVMQDHPNDPERRQMVLRIYKSIPASIPLITGDVVHNLRTSLDHLVCAAVGIGGTITDQTAFPIWRKPRIPTANEYKSLVLRKAKGAPQPFIDLLLTLQPYEGGDQEALWALDYLDARDKHRLLIEALASYRALSLDFGALLDAEFPGEGPVGTLRVAYAPEVKFPLEDGYVLFDAPREHMEKVNPEAAIEVALGEPAVLKGKAVIPELTQLVQFTCSVIDQLRRVL